MKTRNLVIKNNLYSSLETLEIQNIVCKFNCASSNGVYIGVTRVSLRKRFNQQLYNSSRKSYYHIKHFKKIEKEELYQMSHWDLMPNYYSPQVMVKVVKYTCFVVYEFCSKQRM